MTTNTFELCASLKSLTFRKYSFKHIDCNDCESATDAEINEWYCHQAMGDNDYERMMAGYDEAFDDG